MAQFILTLSCPDRTGIVAAVSTFIAERTGSIVEAAHFVDTLSVRSFMRTTFQGDALPDVASMREQFSVVAARYAMDWQLHEAERRTRVLVAVSKQGHCLNRLLHFLHSSRFRRSQHSLSKLCWWQSVREDDRFTQGSLPTVTRSTYQPKSTELRSAQP